jgi:ubiquinone/menaquinone biosynthesis C-methylase UbiE
MLGVAESLPFKRQSFDLILIVAALSLFKISGRPSLRG